MLPEPPISEPDPHDPDECDGCGSARCTCDDAHDLMTELDWIGETCD